MLSSKRSRTSPYPQQLILEAARCIKAVRAGRSSLAKSIYGAKYQNKAILKAVVMGVAREWPRLFQAILPTPKAFGIDLELMAVLLHELDGSRDKRRVLGILLSFDERRHEILAAYRQIKQAIPPYQECPFPFKHARLTHVDNVGRELRMVEGVPLKADQVCRDNLIPGLFIFRGDQNFHRLTAYREGEVIIQDKASCLPAFVLDPPPGSVVVDACAAPGNKSSQLWAAVGLQGVVTSVERDAGRFETLRKMLSRAKLPTTHCRHLDFLEYADAECTHILLDPSCSGSGMPLTLERQLQHDDSFSDSVERLAELAAVQTSLLLHAMDPIKFPRCTRIVYSTCSVHEEENERVVERVVERVLAMNASWKLVPCLASSSRSWPCPGLPHYRFHDLVLRSYPHNVDSDCGACEDLLYSSGLGFFVACFELSAR